MSGENMKRYCAYTPRRKKMCNLFTSSVFVPNADQTGQDFAKKNQLEI